jgi:hypothetical protein
VRGGVTTAGSARRSGRAGPARVACWPEGIQDVGAGGAALMGGAYGESFSLSVCLSVCLSLSFSLSPPPSLPLSLSLSLSEDVGVGVAGLGEVHEGEARVGRVGVEAAAHARPEVGRQEDLYIYTHIHNIYIIHIYIYMSA